MVFCTDCSVGWRNSNAVMRCFRGSTPCSCLASGKWTCLDQCLMLSRWEVAIGIRKKTTERESRHRHGLLRRTLPRR